MICKKCGSDRNPPPCVCGYCRLESNRKSQLKRYRSERGVLLSKWRSIKHRGMSIPTKNTDFTREEFLQWGLNSKVFHDLYEKWISSGYSRSESPSVDRIDASKGYLKDNVQWLTQAENLKKEHLVDYPTETVEVPDYVGF